MSDSIALSTTTRQDSFSDYLCLTAYKANRLESRCKIADGQGDTYKLKSWFVPMPQTIGRLTSHNYESVETSFAYALEKQKTSGGFRTTLGNIGGQKLNDLLKSISEGIGQGVAVLPGGQDFINTATSAIPQILGNAAVDMIQSQLSMATDQPAVGMSNQELFYTGTLRRDYTLSYEFTAKSSQDIYGPNGILQIISQLEAYSFPSTFQHDVSNRDLIHVPPIWTIQHAMVSPSGSVGIVQDTPLANLGQPKLLILANVDVAHDTKVVAIEGNRSFPLRTSLKLTFSEMEPVVRFDGGVASYGDGKIEAPELLTRSQVYCRFKTPKDYPKSIPTTGGD